jgi:predicted enzyme related to lactoylglutathione lyase
VANQIVWVDIPVRDLDRAIKFYSAVLGAQVHKEEIPGAPIGVLPHSEGDVGGCLVPHPDSTPAGGPLLYLNANGRLDQAIAASANNGGRVLEPKHQIGPHGYRAIVLDSEGNRIALHSE